MNPTPRTCGLDKLVIAGEISQSQYDAGLKLRRDYEISFAGSLRSCLAHLSSGGRSPSGDTGSDVRRSSLRAFDDARVALDGTTKREVWDSPSNLLLHFVVADQSLADIAALIGVSTPTAAITRIRLHLAVLAEHYRNQSEMPPNLLTRRKAAAAVGLRERSIDRAMKGRELRHIRLGGRIFITERDLAAWVERCASGPVSVAA